MKANLTEFQINLIRKSIYGKQKKESEEKKFDNMSSEIEISELVIGEN
jgi:hypothetical protein